MPQLLTPLAKADRNRLIQEVNRLSTVKSIHGKVDIQFEDTSFASSGIADQYRLVDGTITCNVPARSTRSFSSLSSTSRRWRPTANTFSVAVLKGDDKYKRFVKGTNSADYGKFDADGDGRSTTNRQAKDRERNCQRAFKSASATSDRRIHDSSDRAEQLFDLRAKRVFSGRAGYSSSGEERRARDARLLSARGVFHGHAW